MSTLKEKYRPRSLGDVVGQPFVRQLQNLARNPKSCCVLLEGATGTGKSTCAQALANDLGCVDGWQESVYTLCAADLDAETARRYFGPESPFRFCAPGKGYHVLILEELEYMNKTVQVILKDALERLLAKYRVIVFATSNDSSALPKPVLHRFGLKFAMSAGQSFADSVSRDELKDSAGLRAAVATKLSAAMASIEGMMVNLPRRAINRRQSEK